MRAVRRRVGGFIVVFVLIASTLIGRAFYLQVLCADVWQERASDQHQKIIRLTPQRGAIFDRGGEALAISLEADSFYLDPTRMREELQLPAGSDVYRMHARALARILDLDTKSILQRMGTDKRFIWLKRRVTREQAKQVEALAIPGVGSIKEHKRWYPNGRLAGQVVGFSGTDNEGLEGLERYYNSTLAGGESYLVTRKDATGRSFGSSRQVVKGKLGSDIYLTIDKLIQHISERELSKAVRDSGSRYGTVLVMDPHSGEILAMASYPDYDPNEFGRFSAAQRRNRVICDAYEPGSTFKIFTFAAALEAGEITPETLIDCERGFYTVGGKTIHDYRPMEELTARDAFKYSSNVGVAKIAERLGPQRFHHYLKQFAFGEQSEIKFDGEAGGILHPVSRWFPIDLAAISFGQGLTVTPLQLGRALSAVVNGGELLEPRLVKKVVDREHDQTNIVPRRVERRVISPATAAAMRAMMVSVTADDGTGSRARVPGFVVGGKTGTAQKVDTVTGGYSPDKRVSSFAGFAPADNPRLVVVVTLDEPVGDAYGGLLAAPVFSEIVEQSLRYLHVPAQVEPERVATVHLAPPVVENYSALGPELLQVDIDADAIPDFRGMSARQVLQAMERTGLNIHIEGYGRVVKQTPPPGNAVDPNTRLSVLLQPPE
ncbi:MAG: penicillin-binding protein [Desulfuromonadaceae bacterium]|nr:penicillin-binding protein [Desulfuromonadaceae bacterium]